ncbi:hypothetical protein RYR28_002721 [Edwardsiella piscicida]|uniref:hypothetical protein n=1 Tax=Edwardsiella piscicida TaxID=1263550 RepID=UPI002907FE1E|nr:hypothetical protein [Edwardsiella piscicida]
MSINHIIKGTNSVYNVYSASGRRISSTNNAAVQEYLLEAFDPIEGITDRHTAIIIDDIVRGATGQVGGGERRVSSSKVIRLLMSLTIINTETVKDALNRKQVVLYGKLYAKSTVEFYTRVLRCASQGIWHHVIIKDIS